MTTLPNELSLREMNSTEKLDTSSICEKTNRVTVFGMKNGSESENEEETKAMMDQFHKDDEDESDSSSSTRKSCIDNGSGLNQSIGDCLGTGNPMNIDPLTNTCCAGQQLRSNIQECSVLLTENSNDDKGIQKDVTYRQMQAKQDDSKTATKTGKLKLAAVVITVSLLVIGLITTGIIIKNKTMEIDQMAKEINAMRKIDTTSKTVTDEDATEYNIYQEYKNITILCSNDKEKTDKCLNMITQCMTPPSSYQDISLPMSCNRTVNGTSIRVDLFNKFVSEITNNIQNTQEISSVNCGAALCHPNACILDTAVTYNCDSYTDFKTNMWKQMMDTCNALKQGTRTIFRMGVVHQHMNYIANLKGEANLPSNVVGALRNVTESGITNCLKKAKTYAVNDN